MTTLILLRHPPCLAGEGRCYGRLDLPVQAATLQEASQRLRGQLPRLPIYSSPARRCLSLARQFDPQARTLTDLWELDFGRWEGQPWDAIPRVELDAWAQDLWHYRPGGGESASMLRTRWLAVCARVRREAPEGAILFSHAGLIRLALAEAGLLADQERWSAPIAHAAPYRLTLNDN